ncbi:MAG: HAD hydrolase-like protein [Desulfobacteraceae bacterium]|nr:HAD hydrolase-like protein [Desulfobacteraceae bacterium]
MDRIKAVVFDCDGVMFDTAEVNRLYYNQLLEHFNKPALTDEQFVKVHMFSVKAAVEYLFPEKNGLDDVYGYMKGLKYADFIRYMVMEPGLKSLLDSLRTGGYIRAVATNRTNTMGAVLKAFDLENSFEAVVTAADVENAKPSPDQLLKIMDQFELKAGELLFIGDSQFDEMAAAGAGTAFIAFKNPSLTADYHFSAMAQIGGLLNL